jgi:hypothetical protein
MDREGMSEYHRYAKHLRAGTEGELIGEGGSIPGRERNTTIRRKTAGKWQRGTLLD